VVARASRLADRLSASLPPAMQRLLMARAGDARSMRVTVVTCRSSDALPPCSQQSVSATSGRAASSPTRIMGSRSAVVTLSSCSLRSAALVPGGSASAASRGEKRVTT
jgi:hypothetical protein